MKIEFVGSTKGYEPRVIDYAESFTKNPLFDNSLDDTELSDHIDLNYINLCSNYDLLFELDIDMPKFGDFVWLPQMYKLPMSKNSDTFDANLDVHLIENFSKKILVKSEDSEFGDSVRHESTNFWRINLVRTGLKQEYNYDEDFQTLKKQIQKASTVFELPQSNFSGCIKWVRLVEVENLIGTSNPLL